MILEDVQGITAKLECGVQITIHFLDEYEKTIMLIPAVKTALAL
jgi:hypothetical protein